MQYLFISFFLFFIFSCGKENSKPNSNKQMMSEEEFEVESDLIKRLQGEYTTVLRPINSQTSGYLPSGQGKISINEHNVSIETYLDDDAFVKHRQGIYEGERCPQKKDDLNQDGIIDQIELEKVTGMMLIPFDADLNQQIDSLEFFPKGRSFTYRKRGNLSLMLKDLYDADENLKDDLVKLKWSEELNLDRRIILVHGTDRYAQIPSSALFKNNLSKYLSIAVTCGKLQRKTKGDGYVYANVTRTQNPRNELRIMRK